jgi:flagellar hook-length control protein FliK
LKIPPPTKLPERPKVEPDKNAQKQTDAQSAHVESSTASTASTRSTKPGALSGSASARRDFASVLKEVTRNSSRQDAEGDEQDARSETGSTGDVEGQSKAVREEDARDAGAGGEGAGLGMRAGVEPAFLSETTSTRAILHIADLEKIVAAVRSRVYADGSSEVTLELKRSVLEGLRVRLSADETGRVTAEFIAATERVRAQIEARSADLAEMLRSRGVNLAAVKTSVGADTSEQRERESRRQPEARAAGRIDGAQAAQLQSEATDEALDEDALGSGTSYRA